MSLGKTPDEDPVSGIYVENFNLINTENGIRIKTWPDSHPSVVSDVPIKDIRVQDVETPLVVDQNYCPWNQCSTKVPVAVKLYCSKAFPCQNVELTDIDLKYTGKEVAAANSTCANVKPIIKDIQNPKLCVNS